MNLLARPPRLCRGRAGPCQTLQERGTETHRLSFTPDPRAFVPAASSRTALPPGQIPAKGTGLGYSPLRTQLRPVTPDLLTRSLIPLDAPPRRHWQRGMEWPQRLRAHALDLSSFVPWHGARLRCIVNRLNNPTYQGDRRTAPRRGSGCHRGAATSSDAIPLVHSEQGAWTCAAQCPQSCARRRIPRHQAPVTSFLLCGAQAQATCVSPSSAHSLQGMGKEPVAGPKHLSLPVTTRTKTHPQ